MTFPAFLGDDDLQDHVCGSKSSVVIEPEMKASAASAYPLKHIFW